MIHFCSSCMKCELCLRLYIRGQKKSEVLETVFPPFSKYLTRVLKSKTWILSITIYCWWKFDRLIQPESTIMKQIKALCLGYKKVPNDFSKIYQTKLRSKNNFCFWIFFFFRLNLGNVELFDFFFCLNCVWVVESIDM